MLDSLSISLIAACGAAFFGLHGAVGLAIKNRFLRNYYADKPCFKVVKSKDTYSSIFKVACTAGIFYSIVLFILICGIYHNETHILLLNAVMITALLSSVYFSFKMFFILRIVCIGCIRIHLANLMMSSAIIFYNFHQNLPTN